MTTHSQLHLQAMPLAMNPRYSQVKREYSLPLITTGVGLCTTTANNAKPIKAFLKTFLDLQHLEKKDKLQCSPGHGVPKVLAGCLRRRDFPEGPILALC